MSSPPATVTDGAWSSFFPAADLNDAAGRGLCRVAQVGRVYEADDLADFLRALAAGPYVPCRYAGHNCWLVVRVRDFAAVANHGDSREAAEKDAQVRNGIAT